MLPRKTPKEITKNTASPSLEKIANRFNFFGSMNSILNNVVNLATHRSSVFNAFWTESLPYYVTGLFYLLPVALPLALSSNDFCHYKKEKNECDSEVEEVINLMNSLEGNPHFKTFLKENPQAKKTLYEKIQKFQQDGKNIKIDILINSIYFFLAGSHATLWFLKGSKAAPDEVTDQLDDWLNLANTIINLCYVSAMMVHKHFHVHAVVEKKKGFQKFNRHFFKGVHAFMNASKQNAAAEEKENALDEPLLLPHHIP